MPRTIRTSSLARRRRPWRIVPVKALKTRRQWPQRKSRTGRGGGGGPPCGRPEAARARQALGVKRLANWLAGVLVHQLGDREVHGCLLGPGDTVGHP